MAFNMENWITCPHCNLKQYREGENCKRCGKDVYENSIKSTANNEKPIIEFKGRNGRIELYKNFVRLDRGTAMGFLLQGLKGKKDIYFKNITSIQIKKPGFTVGFLQFSIPGGNESKRGVFNSVSDENTISFAGKEDYEKALKIKEYIGKYMNSSNSSNDADEIEKLHSLMKQGIITKEEFKQKKKKLLVS